MELTTTEFRVESSSRFEILNVSPEVEAVVEAEGIRNALLCVSTPHTSAALSTNEYEEKLLDDMVEKFKELVPPNDGYYHDLDHLFASEQPNAHAHLLAAMLNRQVLIPVQDGQLRLGTFEDVMFYELCGPRDRTVDVTVLQ